MKWLKRIAIALAALLLLVAAAAWWLLGTGAGLRFVLARAEGAMHGALAVRQAQGRLVGPLDLAGVRYDDGQGTVAQVARLHLDLRFWPLLRKRVHVLDLDVAGVDVALPKSSASSSSSGGFSLKPPVALVLDRVHVAGVKIAQGGQPLFDADRLDLAASWTDAGIAVKQLALQAPAGHAELAGTLAVGHRYQGDGKAGFAWRVGDTTYAGTLAAHSDGRHAHADLALTRPLAATLVLDLGQDGNWPWTAHLAAPAFDPKPLLGDSALKRLALDLQGSGDKLGGSLRGTLGLNQYTVQLQPLAARFSGDYKTLQLQQLRLASPQIPGSVSATGQVHLDAKPVNGQLELAWDQLQLPPELAGQALASHGRLAAHGSAEQYHAEGDVAIGPPGKLAQLALNLDGTPKAVSLHTLALKQPQGGLDASGTLTLQPALAWQLDATAQKLDPGQLLAGWNGALDLDLHTRGSITPQGPDATLDLAKLAGTLRARKVRGNGKLHLSPGRVVDGQLALATGGSRVQIDARPGARNDIGLKLAIASLADWLPDAGGKLDGDFRVQGLWPALSVNGHLQGQSLAWQQQRIAHMQLVAGLPDISHPAGKLELRTGGVQAGGLAFRQIHLLAEGSQASHQLALDARGDQLSARLALKGGMQGQDWNGTLSTLDLEPHGMPGWRLQQPARLGWNAGAASLSQLCLSAGTPQLCVSANQDKAGNLDASYRLQALPLALLVDAANAVGGGGVPMRADGTLEGSGKIHRGADGALSGNATIDSAHGSVTYTDHPDQPLLTYDALALKAALSPASQQLDLHAKLDGDGRLDGHLGLAGAQQSLSGQLDLHLASLGFVELFTSAVANVKGGLDGHFQFAGTLHKPAVTGQAALAGFAAEIPDAGLKLEQGRVTVRTTDAQHFDIDGQVKSGDGTLAINGSAGLGSGAATQVTIKGSRFTAADIPAAKVVISPDLALKQDSSGIGVSGSLGIDSADVNLEKLPGGGASSASPDVVVVDQPQPQANDAAMPITASVKVDLGHRTHLVGMGLDGRLGGLLTVNQRPGHAPTGQGQITVGGTYKAYGQNLHIEQGQLLFATTPLDNPGLNIRAVRKLNPNATIDEGQEVGLLISGTAQRPVLTVFSNPVMEQSDALSYLVTGKPLSQVRGGEGNMVGAAAQALGSATGDLLAKSVGAKTGLDMGVSSSDALGGSAAFTVGKYLSPRLYLSYGVGLFDPGQVITLRFRISHRWNFQAENATDFSRASFNYRYEH